MAKKTAKKKVNGQFVMKDAIEKAHDDFHSGYAHIEITEEKEKTPLWVQVAALMIVIGGVYGFFGMSHQLANWTYNASVSVRDSWYAADHRDDVKAVSINDFSGRCTLSTDVYTRYYVEDSGKVSTSSSIGDNRFVAGTFSLTKLGKVYPEVYSVVCDK